MSKVIDLSQHRNKNPAPGVAQRHADQDPMSRNVLLFAGRETVPDENDSDENDSDENDSDENDSASRSDSTAGRVPAEETARLSETADRRLRAARLWITLNRPYYSRALFSCPLIATRQVETMAIDDRWRIYVNSAYVEARSVEETAAVLIHELNHGMRAHSRRAGTLGVQSGETQVWNAAGDCEINDDLVQDGLELPDGLLPGKFDLEDGRTAEHYFEELMKQATVIKVELHCGSGCTGQPADYEEGPAGRPDTADGLDPVEQDMLRRVVADAVRQHARAKGIGTIPAGLRRWADQTLDPKVDWRRALESAVRRGVHLRAGAADYTWQRPSRRDDSGEPIIRPGMTRPVPDIAVVVDTSGSMGDQDLARALAEIRGILTRVVPGDGLRVYSVDADVAAEGQVFNARQISLVGGGGTDMRVGIEAAIAARPAVIIVITDGFTPWPETRPPGAPLTIAALTDDRALAAVPAWIKAIDISDD